MSLIPKWFERKFDFTFPAEQYPNVCARLRGTPARLDELVRDVASDVLLAKPNDQWSAQEQSGHLLDMEPLWLKRVKDFLGNGTALTAADLSNRKTHEARHNEQQIAHILAGFRLARAQLVARLDTLESAHFTNSLLHPRLLQPMRLVDHLYFVAEHDDHHLAQIWERVRSGR